MVPFVGHFLPATSFVLPQFKCYDLVFRSLTPEEYDHLYCSMNTEKLPYKLLLQLCYAYDTLYVVYSHTQYCWCLQVVVQKHEYRRILMKMHIIAVFAAAALQHPLLQYNILLQHSTILLLVYL